MSPVTASLFPVISLSQHQTAPSRLLMFFLTFGPCFVILSISVEGLFYLAYSTTLVLWIKVEAALRRDDSIVHRMQAYQFRADDTRIALFFLFFVQVAFFGTGK